MPGAAATAQSSAADYLAIMRLRQAESTYADVLVKTNEQLSYRWNWLAALVGALGVSVAVLAVGAVGIQIWQSGSFRRRRKKLLGEFEQRMAALEKAELEKHERSRQDLQRAVQHFLDRMEQKDETRAAAAAQRLAAASEAAVAAKTSITTTRDQVFDEFRREILEDRRMERQEILNFVKQAVDATSPKTVVDPANSMWAFAVRRPERVVMDALGRLQFPLEVGQDRSVITWHVSPLGPEETRVALTARGLGNLAGPLRDFLQESLGIPSDHVRLMRPEP